MSYLLLFMFYANTKGLKDDVHGVTQGNVGYVMYFSPIYERCSAFVHEVVKLNSSCLTNVLKFFSSPPGGALYSTGSKSCIKPFYCQTIHSQKDSWG